MKSIDMVKAAVLQSILIDSSLRKVGEYEVRKIDRQAFQIKIWPHGRTRPPRYFTVKVTENY